MLSDTNRVHDSGSGPEPDGHLPASPNFPEDGPHLPTMPDPVKDPQTGLHLPADPDPAKKPVPFDEPGNPDDGSEPSRQIAQ